MYKKVISVLMVAFMLIGLIGCGEKEPELPGIWILESEENELYMEMFSDGTGIVGFISDNGDLEKYDFSWIAENGRLKITLDFGILGSTSEASEYELSQDTLKLLLDTGEVEIYYRDDGTVQNMMNKKETSEK